MAGQRFAGRRSCGRRQAPSRLPSGLGGNLGSAPASSLGASAASLENPVPHGCARGDTLSLYVPAPVQIMAPKLLRQIVVVNIQRTEPFCKRQGADLMLV